MSMGPLGGIAGSAAGSPLAQTKGSDVERTKDESNSQKRQVESEKKAETASGIGETDGEDHETAERDADGRRLWEATPKTDGSSESKEGEGDERQSKDATGKSGNLLDLSG